MLQTIEKGKCECNPAFFIGFCKCLDTETGEEFEFHLDADGETGWEWQRDVLNDWLTSSKSVELKARQLGITWLAAAFALWHLLFRPGTRVLAVSINEKEASKLIRRIWTIYRALPTHLTNHVKAVKPARGEPSTEIELRHVFEKEKLSVALGLPSTPKAGHGETAALVILDEFARQEYARDTWKAVLPTASKGGRILVISTGNGISTEEGDGNFFHYLYKHADDLGIAKRFLRWDLHPDRDEEWYRNNAMPLLPADRGEQYPRNEREAFILTGTPYFDIEALADYEDRLAEPVRQGMFEETGKGKAVFLPKDTGGWIKIYEEPREDTKYVIAADPATGTGADYSAAYVLDLSTMAIVAEFHAKLEADLYAAQLHYLGRKYGTALLAVEDAGGHGDAVTICLRSVTHGRPIYPAQYRHRQFSRSDHAEHKPFGFPMNAKTRPQVLQQLSLHLKERSFPWLTSGALDELRTFVHRETRPTPRAQDGCHDDRVMALAVAVELWRQYAEHPDRWRGTRPKRKVRKRAWEMAA